MIILMKMLTSTINQRGPLGAVCCTPLPRDRALGAKRRRQRKESQAAGAPLACSSGVTDGGKHRRRISKSLKKSANQEKVEIKDKPPNPLSANAIRLSICYQRPLQPDNWEPAIRCLPAQMLGHRRPFARLSLDSAWCHLRLVGLCSKSVSPLGEKAR
ncbi:hypothetical protein GRJ2_002244500 [Grus japonensis]|uniref:Uncharacterized protein n=1 Tax=Grus japonensis TaxID=30415 RepID=A0ABC9XK12_GRUJA